MMKLKELGMYNFVSICMKFEFVTSKLVTKNRFLKLFVTSKI